MRLRPLSEAEAYARCYGDRDENLRFVKLEPRRPRFDIGLSGEDLRRAFEARLDKREPLHETLAERGPEPSAEGSESAAA